MLIFLIYLNVIIRGNKKSRKSVAPLLRKYYQDSGKCYLLLLQSSLIFFVGITAYMKQVINFLTDVIVFAFNT